MKTMILTLIFLLTTSLNALVVGSVSIVTGSVKAQVQQNLISDGVNYIK
jgi:hypothetical protein